MGLPGSSSPRANPAHVTVPLAHKVKGLLNVAGGCLRVDAPRLSVDADGIPMICLPMHAGSQVGLVDRRLEGLQVAVAGHRGS